MKKRCGFCGEVHHTDFFCEKKRLVRDHYVIPAQAKSMDNATMKAHEFLESGLGHMKDRASTYDAPEGERSMGKCVDMFRALTGLQMTEEQGWKFMCCLKLVRSEQGDFRADNFEDLCAYGGLAGEAASKCHPDNQPDK